MKYALICGSLLTATILTIGPLNAEQAFPFLKTDAVRSAYELAQSSWPPETDIVKHAFLVAEDKHFFDRSATRSTITAAITHWYPEPTGRRSLPVSAAIAMALSKDEILDWFVHGIFLGQDCFGVEGAAAAYFNKQVLDLELHEAAFLAALVRSPAQLHPVRSQDRALARRNYVLAEMAKAGFVSLEDSSAAQATPLSVNLPLGTCAPVHE